MCRMGCPETLITDQGREFVNQLSEALYSITQTEHRITSAYHPQVCVAYPVVVYMVYKGNSERSFTVTLHYYNCACVL